MVFRRKVLTVKRSRPTEDHPTPTDEKRSADASREGNAAQSEVNHNTEEKRAPPSYTSHLSADQMDLGISRGTLFQGILRTSKKNCFYGHVLVNLAENELALSKANGCPKLRAKLEPFDTKVTIKVNLQSAASINRSFNGDVVCVEIDNEDEEDSLLSQESSLEAKGENMESMINEEFENEANEFYSSHKPDQDIQSESTKKTVCEKEKNSRSNGPQSSDPYLAVSGKVRGVLKQNRRSFCGSLLGVKLPDTNSKPHLEEEKASMHETVSKPEPFDAGNLPISTFANAQAFQNIHATGNSIMDNFFFFQPYNPAFPRMRVTIPRPLLNSIPIHTLFRTRFLARYTDWDTAHTFPSANIVTVIGEEGDIDVEEKVVLFESNIIDSINISTHENNNYAKDEVQRIVEKYYSEINAANAREGDTTKPSYKDLFAPFFSENRGPQRHDLRHLSIFSIDPQGCKDIDDALHCIPVDKKQLYSEILENSPIGLSEEHRSLAQNIVDAQEDVYFAGIHIADVSHYVEEESKLDLEARRRGTSVYLVNKRINMLPSTLSEYLCSLQSNEERFCFSVIFFITDKGEILTASQKRNKIQYVDIDLSGICITKTVIKSCFEFSYEQAHEVLESEYTQGKALTLIKEPHKVNSNIRASLVGLHKISVSLRKTREENGAIFLSSPEFRFAFSDQSSDFHPTKMINNSLHEELQNDDSTPIDTHSLIEEFMLLGNSIVARTMLHYYPQHALLRNHLPPLTQKRDGQVATNSMFDLMNKELSEKQERISEKLRAEGTVSKEVCLHIDVSSSFNLNSSLSQSVDPLDGDFNHFLKLLVTRAMTRAQYIDSDLNTDVTVPNDTPFMHYGLALPCYTHFTSPIRRYADLIVHRLLSSIFGYSSKPRFMQTPEEIFSGEDFKQVESDSASHAKSLSIYADLKSLTAHLNTQHEKAQTAGRDSQRFFCRLYLIGLPDLRSSSPHSSQGEKLVLSDMKAYVIRKGKAKNATSRDTEEIVVMIPAINIEGELVGLSNQENLAKIHLFEQVNVDVWIVMQSSAKVKGNNLSGPQVEIRIHES